MPLEWKDTDTGLKPYVDGQEVTWAPQPGSQEAFLQCPLFEVLYEGTRGGGKTDTLLMDFYQHVGHGFGSEWRGVIFRRSYPELEDIINKSQKWFGQLCPQAKFNRSEHFWTFPGGEKLFLRHFEKPADYWRFHGHAYTFIGWEELCTWPDDQCLKAMISTMRSSMPGIPIKLRATANPYGVGHNWVKIRYRLPSKGIVGKVIEEDGMKRVSIHSDIRENRVLLLSDPNYIDKLVQAARNEAERRAWVDGDWNIVAGGMFDDVWDAEYHVLPDFPPSKIPPGWRIDRSYDHGQSKPFSVGWWAESNGEPLEYNGRLYGPVRGDLIRFAEWYGWTGKPNEGRRMLSTDIARGILEREEQWGISRRVQVGVADRSVFDAYEPGKSVAGEMLREGIRWEPSDKGPGSRKQGWDQIRILLRNSVPHGGPREDPGLFVLDRCDQFKRTVPVLPRSERDPDDVDTEAEDHIGDETRYRVRQPDKRVYQGDF